MRFGALSVGNHAGGSVSQRRVLVRARVAAAAVLLAARLALASEPASEHDIHFLAEHVPESGMDAHYAALPWPTGRLEPGRWQTSVDFASASTRTDFIELDGPMVAVAGARGVTSRVGFELIAFYGEMNVSGGDGQSLLATSFLRGLPLDLPQLADWSHPRGTMRHFGAGAAMVRELAPAGVPRSAEFVAGLLLERLEVEGFEIDYTLNGGATSGVLDHSSRASFLTPFLGWQQTRTLSERWTWSPRAMLAYPLPPGDFDGRLSGPGFDLSTPSDGHALEIGDPYFTVGLAFAHRPTGLEVDLGGTLFYAAGEHVSHAGVERAVLVHVAWRRR